MIALLRNSSTARVAKLVDALVSGARAARCGGSNPFPGTKWLDNPATFFIFFNTMFTVYSTKVGEWGFPARLTASAVRRGIPSRAICKLIV